MTDPVADKLAQLKQRFAERCRTSLQDLHDAKSDRQRMTAIAHSLAGAGGTFGFPALSEKAARLETLLLENAPDVAKIDSVFAALVDELEAVAR